MSGVPAELAHLGADGLEVALERLGIADGLGTPAAEAMAVAVREGEAADAGGDWSSLSAGGRALIDDVAEAFGGVRLTRWAWKGDRSPPAASGGPERGSREPVTPEPPERPAGREAGPPRAPGRSTGPPAIPATAALLPPPVG